jgi:hypothetical protein
LRNPHRRKNEDRWREILVLDVDLEQAALVSRPVGFLQRLNAGQDDQDDYRRRAGSEIKTATDRKSNRGHRPDAGRGRQTLYDFTAGQDGAGTEKPYPETTCAAIRDGSRTTF